MSVKINGTTSGSMFMYMRSRWPDYAGAGVYPANGGTNAGFPLIFDNGVSDIHGDAEWTLNLSDATWAL